MLAYTSVGITLNFLVSTLICIRIFLLAKHLKAALGEGAAHVYTNTAAMIISHPLSADSSAALTSLGDQLAANHWIEAAHIW